MSRPPTPKQKRYRGRIRADMRSAYRHILALSRWDAKFRAKPLDSYPNQLASPGEIAILTSMGVQLSFWLQAKGPIPSR